MSRRRKLGVAFGVILLIVGLASFIPRAASLSSTVYQMIMLNSLPAGASVDSTIRQVVCVDPVTFALTSCSGAPTGTPSPSPLPTPTLPLSQANGGTGTTSLNNAYINQSVYTTAGNPILTLNGTTNGVTSPLVTYTLPSGVLGPYDVLRCASYGDLQNNSGAAQSYIFNTTVGPRTLSAGAGITQPSSASYRAWEASFLVEGNGATNLNSLDYLVDISAAGGVTGASGGATSPAFRARYSQSGVDFGSAVTLGVGVVVGVATPAATPTVAPTAATTPILHITAFNCWRQPAATPTP